ncbi:MAG TPA: hypothetical protein VIK98_05860 [Limnochordales bacterium]
MENERQDSQPRNSQERKPEPDNVRYLDEWRAQHRRYYAAKTEALRGRKGRLGRTGQRQGGATRSPGSWPYRPAPIGPVPAAPARRWTWLFWCLPVVVGAIAWLAASGNDSAPAPPASEQAPVLELWAPGAYGRDAELQALLLSFEEAHGVKVRWQARPLDSYELMHALLVGPAPDVILIDQETGLRLMGMDALLPLVEPQEGELPQYVLPLAEETFWVRSLRAAIPRRAAHPDLAQAFVAFLASAVSSRSGTY